MRIALATVGTTGDVAPFALLARRLVERRHEVTAVSWPVHRAALAQPGVRVEVAGPHADPARIASVAADAARRRGMDQVAVLRDFHLADGETHYRQLRSLLPGHDLVILHGIHTLAHAAALDLGLPWATAVFDPVLLRTSTVPAPGLPNLGPLNGIGWKLLERLLARSGSGLDDLLSRAGSAQRALPLFRARSPRLHLVACSPAIIEVPPDWPAEARVTGAWIDRSPVPSLPPQVARFVADGAPPIVITFGSMDGASEPALVAAVGALLDGGRRVVIQHRLPSAPASPNLLAIGPVDHRALFPAASLVVHHGGAGTTHAACAAGVPSLVVPHVGDQRYWADRLRRIGVAPAPLPVGSLTAGRLADAALAAAVDHDLHAAAEALASRIGLEDGLGAAVAAIERVADEPPTPVAA
jgi:UDP:flavonoid glycosyltransferase YjiC (YdhE family)